MSLSLHEVTKRYGAQLALDRASIDVRAGDVYGFIGHNGSGKTTAMRVALGLVHANSGVVHVDGLDAAREPREARARSGGLIETPGFHGPWSGTRNLVELGRLQGMTRTDAQREAQLQIERVGLGSAGSKPVQAYSQGMRQRLGIAQALLGSPRVVLLDEPTNGLDPEGIAEMRELIRRLNRDLGITFVVSSHLLHELESICNRFGVLKQGRLVAEVDTQSLFSTSTRYRIETTTLDAARALLAQAGITADNASTGRALTFDVGGRAPADVASRLVGAGIPLSAFAPVERSLEEIYLRFPAGADWRPATVLPEAVPPVRRSAPRDPLRRVLSADLRRWAGSISVPLLLATPALAGALAMARRAAQAGEDARAVGSNEVFSATDVNGFEAVGLALQAGLPVLVCVALGLASQSVAAELARGTLRNTLLRPVTRAQAVVGKFAAVLAAVLSSYALLAIVALGVARATFGFGDVDEVLPNGEHFTLVPAADLWPDLGRVLATPILPLVAYAALGFLASCVARVAAAALATALGIGVVLDLGRSFARTLGARSMLPSEHLPSPLSDTSFVQFYVDVATGVSNATFEHGWASAWVPALWAWAALSLAFVILRRRDVP